MHIHALRVMMSPQAEFSHSNWSPTSGAEINGTSLLDFQVKQAMGDQALILNRLIGV